MKPNYLIVCQMRSGSSYLGELIGNHDGLEYYNELFTPEICRRRFIWPIELDDRLNTEVLRHAYSRPGSGFKLVYNQGPAELWAMLALKRNLRVIHILRENLLQQLASILYLERVGVSMARLDEKGMTYQYDTAGNKCGPQRHFRMILPAKDCEKHFRECEGARYFSWRLFHERKHYLEVQFEDLFSEEKQAEIMAFLGCEYKPEARPNQVKTPRPGARRMFSNYWQLRQHFKGTRYGWFF